MFLFLFIKLLQAINAENEGARASSREGREQTKVSSFLIVFFFGVFVYTCISEIGITTTDSNFSFPIQIFP